MADMTDHDDLFDIFGSSHENNGDHNGDQNDNNSNDNPGNELHVDGHVESAVDADSYFGNGPIIDPDNVWGSILGYDSNGVLAGGDGTEIDAGTFRSQNTVSQQLADEQPAPTALIIPDDAAEEEDALQGQEDSPSGKDAPSPSSRADGAEVQSEPVQGEDADKDGPAVDLEAGAGETAGSQEQEEQALETQIQGEQARGEQAQNEHGDSVESDIPVGITSDITADEAVPDTPLTNNTTNKPQPKPSEASSFLAAFRSDARAIQSQDIAMRSANTKMKQAEYDEGEYEDDADAGEDEDDDEEEEDEDAAHKRVPRNEYDSEDGMDISEADTTPFVSSKDMVMPGDGSRLEVILDPFPEERQDEYEVLGPSQYVYRVITRVRGRSRYIVEFDDTRRYELYEKDIADLPNGSRALSQFKRKDREETDELSAAMGYYTGTNSPASAWPDTMDLDSDDELGLSRRQRRRPGLRQSSRLAANPTLVDTQDAPTYTQDDDADELAGSDDADFIPTITSDLQHAPKLRRGRKKKAFKVSSGEGARESSIEFEHRRSSRANKNTRSMVDPTNFDDDDDFLVQDDRAPAPVRVVNVKEIFQPVDDPSAFKDMHSQVCDSCGLPARTPNKGIMIHCQGCSLSYHRQCIGHRAARDHVCTKVGEDSFVLQCRFCVNQPQAKDPNAPDLDKCQGCRKPGLSCAAFAKKQTAKQEEKLRLSNDGVDPITKVAPELINNADNVMFRCVSCRAAYHFEHLPPPSEDSMDAESDKVRQERFEDYSTDWKCRMCLDTPAKVSALIAWRPKNKESYDPEQAFANTMEDDKEYLIKWDEKSYAHCEWRPGAWVWGATHGRMRLTFAKKNGELGTPPVFETNDAFPEEYLFTDIIFMVRYKRQSNNATSKEEDLKRIEDIDQVLVKFQGLNYDDTVWDAPPPRDSGKRWTTFYMAYDEYLNGKHFKSESHNRMRQRIKDYQAKKFEVVNEQPAVLRRGKLMPYQMEGLNWLLLNFYKTKSVVLADEMGLGKTVQVVALLASLVLENPQCWPFLIVVPNSTCPNWRREIKNWVPDLRVVSYHGGKGPQSLAYKYELFPDGSQTMKAHVVIMSYDSAQDENTRRLFHNVHWAGLVVDEGQRLKNDQNILYLALRAMRISFRLLLTGTPLQNNKRELFNLIQFVDSSNNAADLDREYATITSENLPELHKLIRPYFLRRTKAEVLKFLPPMAQIIVPVSMTVVQEKLCKSIMAKNPQLIRSIFSKDQVRPTERGSLNNILMQLRKCLCHPFVYSDAIEDKALPIETMHRNLIEASSKLMLLKIMLPKLRERGHRVLIFSQFLNQLDIIEDFLHILDLPYQRLDGSVSTLVKQKRIDAFNEPGSEIFAFLLSTRAGGVGINLATADTVIVMDPDFNPHQDIQAFSRAHRIGQKKKVLCFQFMTKDSVEEKIMQIGRNKMALDHALIESMDAEDDAGNDLESILKHGAAALFGEGESNRIVYDSASVDKLLDRSQVENTRTDDKQSAESQFSFARVWANESGTLADDIQVSTAPEDIDDSNSAVLSVWEKIIKDREEEAARKAAAMQEVLGRGGRRRTQVTYTDLPNDNDYFEDGLDDGKEGAHGNGNEDGADDPDGEFSAHDDASSSDEDGGHAVAADAAALENTNTRTRKSQVPAHVPTPVPAYVPATNAGPGLAVSPAALQLVSQATQFNASMHQQHQQPQQHRQKPRPLPVGARTWKQYTDGNPAQKRPHEQAAKQIRMQQAEERKQRQAQEEQQRQLHQQQLHNQHLQQQQAQEQLHQKLYQQQQQQQQHQQHLQQQQYHQQQLSLQQQQYQQQDQLSERQLNEKQLGEQQLYQQQVLDQLQQQQQLLQERLQVQLQQQQLYQLQLAMQQLPPDVNIADNTKMQSAIQHTIQQTVAQLEAIIQQRRAAQWEQEKIIDKRAQLLGQRKLSTREQAQSLATAATKPASKPALNIQPPATTQPLNKVASLGQGFGLPPPQQQQPQQQQQQQQPRRNETSFPNPPPPHSSHFLPQQQQPQQPSQPNQPNQTYRAKQLVGKNLTTGKPLYSYVTVGGSRPDHSSVPQEELAMPSAKTEAPPFYMSQEKPPNPQFAIPAGPAGVAPTNGAGNTLANNHQLATVSNTLLVQDRDSCLMHLYKRRNKYIERHNCILEVRQMQIDITRQYSYEQRRKAEETGIFEGFDEAAFKKEKTVAAHQVQASRTQVQQCEARIRDVLGGLHEKLTPANSQIPPDILRELYVIKDSPERNFRLQKMRNRAIGPTRPGDIPPGIVSGPSSSRPHFQSIQYPMLKFARFSSRIADFETGNVAGAEAGDDDEDEDVDDVEVGLDEDFDVDDDLEADFKANFEAGQEAEEEAEEDPEVEVVTGLYSSSDANVSEPLPKTMPQSETQSQPAVSNSVPLETPLKRRGRGRPPGSKAKNKKVKTGLESPHILPSPVPAATQLPRMGSGALLPAPRPSPPAPAPPEPTPKRRGPGRPPLSHKKVSSSAFRPAPASASASSSTARPPSSSSTPSSQPRMVVQLEIQPAARCRRCNQPYPSGTGCQNQDCEVGIRLVLDSLRSSPLDEATRQATRKRLVAKLKAIMELKAA